jgi:hypothetical protein
VLAGLAAAPQLWWDLVRFDPDGPVRVPLPGADGAWLLILPPGGAAQCDCRYATLLAGEAGEGPAPLRPGRVRVRGRPAPHLVRGAGHGYSVSLHFLSGTERCACFPPPLLPLGEYGQIITASDADYRDCRADWGRHLERTDNP